MKLDREKLEFAKARACMSQKDLEEAGIPKGTLCRAMSQNIRPKTAGKIAKALGVDVTEMHKRLFSRFFICSVFCYKIKLTSVNGKGTTWKKSWKTK